MNKPILVILAAGMGSRYGGLKQIDPIGPNREILMDYSLFDAAQAGFERVIFIIKRENRDDFAAAIGDRAADRFEVRYAYQELDDLPPGFAVPQDRVKPWGTGHAVLAARSMIDAPFCVINADDYYGPEAYRMAYSYLQEMDQTGKPVFLMVAYELLKTLSKYGHVSRGVCQIDDAQRLVRLDERTRISLEHDRVFYTDDRNIRHPLAADTRVSMNFWGFGPQMVDYLQTTFPAFLEQAVRENPQKAEFFLPVQVAEMISDGLAEVEVRSCGEQWYGVTYHEDKPVVVSAISQMIADGRYPSPLWSQK